LTLPSRGGNDSGREKDAYARERRTRIQRGRGEREEASRARKRKNGDGVADDDNCGVYVVSVRGAGSLRGLHICGVQCNTNTVKTS
jgi:hypothetical protein